jgi:predicted outer membrane lipoprotein
MATAPPAASPSPIEAARQAWEQTRRELFPVRVEKWLALGLLAFLDQCGRTFRGGGGGPGGRHVGTGEPWHPGPGGPWPGGRELEWLQRAGDWLAAHAAAVAIGAVALVLVFALVAAVVLWLNARGVFMYVDAVATGRTDLGRQWREHGRAASSYFGWSLGISLAGLFAILLAVGLAVSTVLAFASGRLAGTGGWLLAAGMLPVFLLIALALPILALAALALRDFVAPLQMATGLPCGGAARLLESLVLAQPGAFVLYLLLKLLVVIATGIVIVIGGCLTCCVGFLPIVLQTLFQPLFHFERGISIRLLAQMGYDPASPRAVA